MLSRNQLKYIAVAAMVLDHTGFFFFPIHSYPLVGTLLRVIGRLTMPIMCYFLAEGYQYTSSRKKYAIRLGVFALLSQVPYSLAFSGKWIDYKLNVIFTLFVAFLTLMLFDRVRKNYMWLLAVGGMLALSSLGDWGMFAPLYVLVFYIHRGNRRLQIRDFSIVSLGMIILYTASNVVNDYAWYSLLWMLGVYLFIPALLLYNGKPGSKAAFHKWFFYIFYPLHLLVIWWIRTML